MREYSIYIHIPFCISKCRYCDFNSYSNKDEFIERYVLELIKQIQKDNSFNKEDICKTIYIGGGTPSCIDSKYIVMILKTIFSKYTVEKNAEITIEQNPTSMTLEKLQDYYNVGINRLSIGLQTSNNNLLDMIGRKHTFELFTEKYKLARECGFENINIDLMIGLPNQTLENVKLDLRRIIKLNPEHISCYSLILYENAPLYDLIKKYRCVLPDEKLDREMYYLVTNTLNNTGYIQYEISNFSKINMESKHNLMCWNQYEYIGFGAGAHSFINGVRFENSQNIEDYILNNRICILENMDEIQLMNEYMLLGMRLLSGIDIERFEQKFNKDMLEFFQKQISYLENNGYIKVLDDKRAILTQKGVDFNNVICEQFIL